MTGFIVSRVVVHDRKLFNEYLEESFPILRTFGGRALAVREPDILEGDGKWELSTVVSFPSAEVAREFYDSEAYQEVAKKRYASTTSDAHLLDGLIEGF